MPLLLLFAAPDDALPNPNPPPVFDAPKPVFVAVLVFAPHGLLVVFVAPKPPDVLPPPKSEPPVFDAPKLGVAGLFRPNAPGKVSEFDFDSTVLGGCSIPPPVPPNPPPVLAVLPNPPPLLPKPPDVAVVLPNSPLPVLVVFGAPKAVLVPPNGELLLVFDPNPPNPPDVAVLPPNSEPPVEALVEPKPLPVFVLPKPPKALCCGLLLLPKPKDMLAVAEVECVSEEVACAGRN